MTEVLTAFFQTDHWLVVLYGAGFALENGLLPLFEIVNGICNADSHFQVPILSWNNLACSSEIATVNLGIQFILCCESFLFWELSRHPFRVRDISSLSWYPVFLLRRAKAWDILSHNAHLFRKTQSVLYFFYQSVSRGNRQYSFHIMEISYLEFVSWQIPSQSCK